MRSTVPATGQQVFLVQNPDGPLRAENFSLEKRPLAAMQPGQFVVRTIFLGIEPRQRLIINPTTPDNVAMRPHGAMCGPGRVIPGSSAGQVIASAHPGFSVGDLVEGFMGWREYVVTDGAPHPTNNPAGVLKCDPSLGSLQDFLCVLGTPGFTALLALRHEGKLRRGETMVVTTAAGLVGSIAAQLGKLAGARVVGLTGRDYKVRYLLDKLRLDQAIDYRAETDLGAAVRKACPQGVDYFFDNTGGSIADVILAQLNPGGRHTNCGQVSSYDTMNWGQSRRFGGQFSIHNHVTEYSGAQCELAALLRSGQLTYHATIFDGLAAAPGALIRLLAGENIGKYLVRVGPDPE